MPGELETIRFDAVTFGRHDNLALLDMVQFQQAKRVYVNYMQMDNFARFSQFGHLQSFCVGFHFMTVQDLLDIRDMLSVSDVFEDCVIKVSRASGNNLANLAVALGNNVRDGPSIIHRHPIPETTLFLEFDFYTMGWISEIRIKKTH